MPQELALYGEFTLRETMLFFGHINKMTTAEVDERTDFLIKLLQLPHSSRFVKSLSGGQQRRTSLAAALLADPELLILDEPTVGVDPVIRQNIWDHLVEITQGGNRTVIITTHYIEETRQAHLIGLMRGGKFLAEESPPHLLQQYNCAGLEDVFLKLAVMQNMGKRRRSSIVQEVSEHITIPAIANPALDISEDDHCEISGEFGDNISMSSRGRDVITPDPIAPLPLPAEETPEVSIFDKLKFAKMHHMRTLVWKNFIWMMRNVGVMAFIIGLPMAQIILFSYAIGHDPNGLKMGVSNNEYPFNPASPNDCPVYEGCNTTLLSCRYLNFLKNRKIDLTFFASDEDADEAVRRGHSWGTLSFPANYTESLVQRTLDGRFTEDWVLESSDMGVKMDMTSECAQIYSWIDSNPHSSNPFSDMQIDSLLFRDLQFAYFDFIGEILTDCEYNPSLGRVPIQFKDPIYGTMEPHFTDFAAPGVILT